jgi:23S rRNA pseudouridine2457 synthase
LAKLATGLVIQGHKTLPCRAWLLEPQPEVGRTTPCAPSLETGTLSLASVGVHGVTRPTIPPRIPPIRFRKSVLDCWIGLELIEGKNRQVRRMTAAIGHPTLRLMRVRIGSLQLGELAAGKWKILSEAERKLVANE